MPQDFYSAQKKPHNIARRITRVVLIIVIILLLIAVGGLAFQSISAAADARQYPPTGEMVDVGGYRLHLTCSGQGSPTIILESGLAGPGLQWALVQQQLEKQNRVCSYDRAGLGWSDDGPLPRTSQVMVSELHTLLHNAGVSGPYVLVGHSLGGFNVRVFAKSYPAEVAGMVLVASGSEDDNERMPPDYRKIEAANIQNDQNLVTITRFGLTRLAGSLGMLSAYTSLLDRFPPALQAEIASQTFYNVRYWQTAFNELSVVNESKAQVSSAGNLGNLPLVVISGSPDVSRLPSSFPVEQIRKTFQDLQVELAGLSTNSTHIVCDTCDHYIPLTDPEKVADAIQQLLAKIR